MIHLPKNCDIALPIDVSLYSGNAPWTGQAGSLSLAILNLDTGYKLDFTGNTFKNSGWTTPTTSVAAYTNRTHDYFKLLSYFSTLPRGHYKAIITHTNGDEFGQDFSVGLYNRFGLGYSTVYSPDTGIKLSIWVEENGVVVTDATAINTVQILSGAGVLVTGGSLGDNSTPSNGVFAFTSGVTLSENTNFILAASAVFPGVNTQSWTFPFRAGLVRP